MSFNKGLWGCTPKGRPLDQSTPIVIWLFGSSCNSRETMLIQVCLNAKRATTLLLFNSPRALELLILLNHLSSNGIFSVSTVQIWCRQMFFNLWCHWHGWWLLFVAFQCQDCQRGGWAWATPHWRGRETNEDAEGGKEAQTLANIDLENKRKENFFFFFLFSKKKKNPLHLF